MSRITKILSIASFSILMMLGSCKNDSNQSNTPQELDDSRVEEVTPDPPTRGGESREQEELENLIQVELPVSESTITSPQEIRGKARGTWFFEGDFAVYLIDENAEKVAVAIAIAQGEWMTTDWVDFTATLEFDVPQAGQGYLVFEKSNPSDKRELDREFRFPVTFTP